MIKTKMTARDMVGKRYKFIKPLRLGNCKMKVGDVIQILDYGAGMASYYVGFKCDRLPSWKFQYADWALLRNVEEIKEYIGGEYETEI